MDSGEKRLHELGYKQELRREMVCLWNLPLHNISKLISIYIFLTVHASFCFSLQTLIKTLAITFSSVAIFSGTPLYGPSLRYAGPASLIWGWVVVSFFTWFVGLALAEICSSFPVCFFFLILFPLDFTPGTQQHPFYFKSHG